MARAGSRGKYWNVGFSDHSRLGVTKRQIWYLTRLTRQNWFGKGLTRGEASDIIEEALADIERKNAGRPAMADKYFHSMFNKAVSAANKAGEEWLQQNPEPLFPVNDQESGETVACHGAVGMAWLTWPKSGTDFHRWLIENVYDGHKSMINIPHRYADRLEVGLQFACEKAALVEFKKSGTDVGDIRLMVRCEEEQILQADQTNQAA